MNELKIFNSVEFGEIRTVTIDGESWFAGKDVAIALGYKDTTQAIRKNVLDEDKMGGCSDAPSITDSLGRTQYPVWINESGLYALIFGSKLESAKRFKRWVTSEVLPSIRKTGSYKPMTIPEQIQLLAQGNANHEERIVKLENTMTIDYGQQKSISDLVSSIVISHLGGKESNAYKEISKKVFAECNRDIKTYFSVNARNNIPKLRFSEAMEYVRNWHPCTNTAMRIRDCNAQMSIS